MNSRTLHRIIGLIIILPFAGWAVTGAIFFLKPGYGGAYESLAVKTYPLDGSIAATANPSWLEYRVLKTILGEHLIVRTSEGWQQLDPKTLQARPDPTEAEVRTLLTDAFTANPGRYGHVASLQGLEATTDTGARVTLAWNRLTLSQRGRDTDRIDGIYKIHYLQWTGMPAVDRILGGVGLAFILILSALGLRLFVAKR